MGALQDLDVDLARLRRFHPGRRGWWRDALMIVGTEELWLIVTYRWARWAMFECRVPVLKPLLVFALKLHIRFLRVLLHAWISPEARIGPGLYINHYGTIWINPRAVIGRFCNLHQGVTIGIGGVGEGYGVPTLGDRVNIGPYAVILGRITIGHDVGIGANSLVVSDLPDNAVAVGVPARIVSRLGGGIPEDPTVPEEQFRVPPSVQAARDAAAGRGASGDTTAGTPRSC